MNKFLSSLVLAFVGLFLVTSHAQGVTLQGPVTPSVSVALTWVAPIASGNFVACNTTTVCEYTAYRIPGTCPATVIGSSGWTTLGTTQASVLAYTDTTVAPLPTYSYVVEAVLISDLMASGPSNCVTVTTGALPLVPNVPTGLL